MSFWDELIDDFTKEVSRKLKKEMPNIVQVVQDKIKKNLEKAAAKPEPKKDPLDGYDIVDAEVIDV